MKTFDKLKGKTMDEIAGDEELFNLYRKKYSPTRGRVSRRVIRNLKK